MTVLPFASSSVIVTACEPPAVATVPWFLTVTVKFTVLPADGLPGVQATDAGIRSELCTGATTSEVGLVKLLLPSLSSMTEFDSSTFAVNAYVPAFWVPMLADTVVDAPVPSAPTDAVPTLVVPR